MNQRAAMPARLPVSHRAALVAMLVALTLCTALLGTRAQGAFAQNAQLHVLTSADNGATLTIPIGDSVELKLDPNYDWTNVTVSDTTVLRRPPVALVRGVQGLWIAQQPGQATINATGTPICAPGVACPQYAIAFNATVVVVPAGNPPPPPGTVTYAAGWNLIGVPPNTQLPVDAYAWNARLGTYNLVAAGAQLVSPGGYWAYFSAATTVALSAGDGLAEVAAPPNTWVIVGNHSGVAPATVTGANVVYTWNPATMQYVATTRLQPGAGAWALSYSGGTVRVTAQGQ